MFLVRLQGHSTLIIFLSLKEELLHDSVKNKKKVLDNFTKKGRLIFTQKPVKNDSYRFFQNNLYVPQLKNG